MKKITILMVIILGVSLVSLWAEEVQDDLENYEIVANYNSKTVQFFEKDSKRVIKTLNTLDDNSYIQKGFEAIKDSKYSNVFIPINELKKYPLTPSLIQFYENIAVDGKIKGRIIPNAFLSEDKKYIGINYGFGILGPLAEYEASYSTTYIKVYNAKGDLIHQAELKDRGCGSFVLSRDAEYLGFKFSFPYDEKKDHKPRGIAVYDLKRNSIVLEEFAKKGWLSAYPGAKNNLMQMEFHNSQNVEMIFIDFSLRKEYKITISRSKRNKLKKITSTGLIFGKKDRKDKETEFLSFEKDFEVIEW